MELIQVFTTHQRHFHILMAIARVFFVFCNFIYYQRTKVIFGSPFIPLQVYKLSAKFSSLILSKKKNPHWVIFDVFTIFSDFFL